MTSPSQLILPEKISETSAPFRTGGATRQTGVRRGTYSLSLTERLARNPVASHNSSAAWMESEHGDRIPLGLSLSLGRSSACDLPLGDSKVSRRHAVMTRQVAREYWLSDLRSANGTLVNGMRVSQPVPLCPGDDIRIGPFRFTFQSISEALAESTWRMSTQQTQVEMRQERRWLLVADIEDSTGLAARFEPVTYRRAVDAWFARSRAVVDRNRGSVNKFLGDGFVACWADTGGVSGSVAATLDAFDQMRANLPVRFRIALHVGEIFVGGLGTMGEECLSGPEVNFAFRMEKVAAANKARLLLSEPAARALAAHVDLGMPCRSSVPGFNGTYTFFVPADSKRSCSPAVDTFSDIAADPAS